MKPIIGYYVYMDDSKSLSGAQKEAAELLRLIMEDRAERAPPGNVMVDHPALEVLLNRRWTDAFGFLLALTEKSVEAEKLQPLLRGAPVKWWQLETDILALVDHMYESHIAGELALAWLMLSASPLRPRSFWGFLPQLQHVLDQADLADEVDRELRARIRVWWRAAGEEWHHDNRSIFAITEDEIGKAIHDFDPPLTGPEGRIKPAPTRSPSLVVLRSPVRLNSYHAPYQAMIDAPLPLRVASNVATIRAILHAEFPHAATAIDLLLRDVREGKVVTIKPVVLVGDSGCGKTRIVRRLAELLKIFMYCYDGAGSTDGQFSGTSKGWSQTEPSIPFRAVFQGQTGNPIVMIDEIDKASSSTAGSLHMSLTSFLETETSTSHHEQSLGAPVNLSAISYVATANTVANLPRHLLDRLRIIKVPSASMAHLPALARDVLRDFAVDDVFLQYASPFGPDELAVMAPAWERKQFSIRALQDIIRATLSARDQTATRH